MTYTLKRCLDDLIVERLKPNGSDTARAQFAADRLIEFFGAQTDVGTLSRKGFRDYRAKRLRAGVNDSTIRRELGVIKAALNFAAEEEKITSVPVVKLPPETPARERWFSEEEVERLMSQPMSEPMRLALYLALGTGARRGAIADLTVGRVDLAGGFIDFRNPKRPVSRKRRVKTKIADWLRPKLVEACKGRKADDLVVGLPPYEISRRMKAMLEAIGIDEKGISLHAMRRTFVTWALLNGAKPAEVSAATGDRIETLERSYLKLFAQHAAGAVNAVNPKGMNNAE